MTGQKGSKLAWAAASRVPGAGRRYACITNQCFGSASQKICQVLALLASVAL